MADTAISKILLIDDEGVRREVTILKVSRERRRVQHPAGGVSMTKQADADKANINSIMAKYVHTGTVPSNMREPWYGDFSNVDDYLTARLQVAEADSAFEALPADVRKHVNNDPAEFMRLVEDPERRAEAVELGLFREEDQVEVSEEAPPVTPPEPTVEST